MIPSAVQRERGETDPLGRRSALISLRMDIAFNLPSLIYFMNFLICICHDAVWLHYIRFSTFWWRKNDQKNHAHAHTHTLSFTTATHCIVWCTTFGFIVSMKHCDVCFFPDSFCSWFFQFWRNWNTVQDFSASLREKMQFQIGWNASNGSCIKNPNWKRKVLRCDKAHTAKL